jgi:hypothetical protein
MWVILFELMTMEVKRVQKRKRRKVVMLKMMSMMMMGTTTVLMMAVESGCLLALKMVWQ